MSFDKREQNKISIIGAGKAGSSMAAALSASGFSIDCLIDEDIDKARHLAGIVGAERYSTALQDAASSNLILIAVPDEKIALIANQMAADRIPAGSAVIAHLSGALPAAELSSLAAIGHSIASCHPCMILNYQPGNVLEGATVSLEGEAVAVSVLVEMMKKVGATVAIISAEKKALYHAACCTASNYLVTLLHAVENMLVSVDPHLDISSLKPLLHQTLATVETVGPADALTGPISRGDLQIIDLHLTALETSCPDLIPLYKALGRATADMSAAALNQPEKSAALMDRLN